MHAAELGVAERENVDALVPIAPATFRHRAPPKGPIRLDQ